MVEFVPEGKSTHVLYLDGSGHQDYAAPYGPSTHHYFAQAGIILPRPRAESFSRDIENAITSHFPEAPAEVEIHAAEIMVDPRHRREEQKTFWQHQPGKQKGAFMASLRKLISSASPEVALLGRVVNKTAYRQQFMAHSRWNGHVPEAPAVNVLRFLLKEVDRYMEAIEGTVAIVFDDDTLMTAYLSLMADVKARGHVAFPYGLSSASPVFYEHILGTKFIDSRKSRNLQIADVVANYTWRAAEVDQANCIRELRGSWAEWKYNGAPFSGLDFYRVNSDVVKRYR